MDSTTPADSGPQQFGLVAALHQGGIITWIVFIMLVVMSAASWYIMLTKLWEQQRIMSQARKVRTSFWGTPSLREGASKLEKNSAYKQIVDDGLRAQDEHTKLLDPVDQHDWLLGSLGRSQAAINSKLGNGLALLATVGSTAPFVGLFGTVLGIMGALIKIGQMGQAPIDKVAGPVGEALIMTAIGLAVAVPAVMGYNWLIRRNKVIAEQIGSFSTHLHGYMVSGGALKPATLAAGRPVVPPVKTGSAAINPKA